MKKMLKANRFIKLGCVFVLALFMTITAVACNQTQTYTMSFVAEGVDIAPIVAEVANHSAVRPRKGKLHLRGLV